ncbi:MAG: hypothetical protein DHS20C13_29850 [Thermodesulfobacteriota bacterium]|nr:MAG: hypothetical protein DHS20C13_29850 [Thermodesulfobacteriota bacterium]
MTLGWTPADANEDGFEVLREEGGVEVPIATLAAGTTTYVDTSVSPNTTYLYRIRAFNALHEDFS